MTSRTRRLWAIGALLLIAASAGLAVAVAVASFPNGLTVLLCLIAAVWAAWLGVTRRGALHLLGLAAAAGLMLGAIALVALEHRLLEDLLIAAGTVAALAAARIAFTTRVELPRAKRPVHPVLFYNPKSGGGKATRFRLADEARARGIEPFELGPGQDLEQMVREAVDRGADALAMAGGDGSQAIVAMIAAEHDLPYACIPAGTRNHFALDLGVDRTDVVGALDALVDGGERRVDLAEVSGRIFVNNVSLGLYAEAVQRPGYRNAKLHTLLATVPDVLGPDAAPRQLRFEGPEGQASAVAALISNNPYRLGRAIGSGTRPRLDRGRLGIAVLTLAASDADHDRPRRLLMRQWTAPSFELGADGRLPLGIDGEATQLEPPLRFRSHPAALRVRIAPHHPGASPSFHQPDTPWQAVRGLVALAIHADRDEPSSSDPRD